MAAATSDRRGSESPPLPKTSGWTFPLLAVAAISATIGFAICIKVWLATSGATNEDILRTANRQYSSDNLIVAGELAKRVKADAEEPEKVMLKHFLGWRRKDTRRGLNDRSPPVTSRVSYGG